MSYTIKRATWGDDSSATDITKTILGMYDTKNNSISVEASQKLLPVVSVSTDSVTLDDSEKQIAKKNAVEMCGNEHDTNCIASRTAAFEQTRLQEKMLAANSTANTIVGRRLTVVVIGPDGKEQTVQVPDGQKFELGSKPAAKPASPPSNSVFSFSAWWNMLPGWAQVIISFASTFFYALGIFIPYRTFMLRDDQITAYALTGVAVVLPYSGYITTPLAIAIYYYMAHRKVASSIQ